MGSMFEINNSITSISGAYIVCLKRLEVPRDDVGTMKKTIELLLIHTPLLLGCSMFLVISTFPLFVALEHLQEISQK
jgi:hypothetical protein